VQAQSTEIFEHNKAWPITLLIDKFEPFGFELLHAPNVVLHEVFLAHGIDDTRIHTTCQ
jgi:hypothetical protein